MKLRALPRLALALAALLLFASACGGGATGGAAATTTAASAATTTAPAETTAGADPATTTAAAAAPANGADPLAAAGLGVEEGANVRFLHIYPEHQNAIDKSINIIKATYDMEISVDVTPWNEATKTIQTASASGEMYDVFFQWNSQVPGYDQIGLLLDLDPYFAADPEWKNSFINEDALKSYANTEGKIMGIPLRGTGVFLIYNKTMFDENGWTEANTQEELVELMDKILAKGDVIPICAPGKPNGFQMESARGRIFDHLVYMAGRIEDPERLTNRVVDWGGLYAQSGEIMKEWYKAGYFGTSPFGIEREEGQTVFFNGSSAMLLCNNNELVALREMNAATGNYELGSFMWPAPAACDQTLFTSAGFGDGWGAWSGSKYPNACAAFLKGFTSKEAMTVWGNEEYSVVAVSGIEYKDNLQQSFAEQFARSGQYRVVADYNTGNLGDLRAQAFVDYMTSDTMTAEEFEKNVGDATRRAIEDAEQ
jgi:ABC-type glycerol-3-phosphate transport system substrate-binding protein